MRWNLPNAITASRLLLAALFGVLLFAGYSRATLLAVFALAALTDLVDGLAARALGQVTPGGAVLDQWVDRIFTVVVVALLVAHAERNGERGVIALLALACAREIVSLPGVAIALARGKPLYHVEFVGKLATFVQSLTLGAILFRAPFAAVLTGGCALVGVVSGASYVRYALGPAKA